MESRTSTDTKGEILSPGVLRELLGAVPRPLVESQGELIFLNGQYLFHWIDKGQEKYKFLSSQTLRAAFMHEPFDSGWLSPGVCRVGSSGAGNWLVKFIPPRITVITLVNYDQEKQGTLRITIPLPGFVFLGLGVNYWLWATKITTFDPHASPLYHAPLPNVYPDGRICFGNNSAPLVAMETMESAWKLFIEESPFGSDLLRGKSAAYPLDIREKLYKLASSGKKKYPLRDLEPISRHMTIDSVITQVISSRS